MKKIPVLSLSAPTTLGALAVQSALVIIVLLIADCVQAQQAKPRSPITEDEVLRVETTLVTLPVGVFDRNGKLVYDLKRQQFHVYENGVEQQIAYFESPADSGDPTTDFNSQPLTIALMLDVSDSTEAKLAQIQKAALGFVDRLRPADRVIVGAFDKNVQFISDATSDREAVRNAITRTRTGGGTSLYTALESVITRLNRTSGRKVIVLLTDGVDTASRGATANSALRAAEASDTVIYPIQYDTYGDFADNAARETSSVGDFGKVAHVTKNGEPVSEAYKRATLYLKMLADKTAGHFQYTDSLKNLARSFERLADKLREQYTLGYYPKNKAADERPRQIKVEVAVPRTTVRTRKSYVYKSRGNR